MGLRLLSAVSLLVLGCGQAPHPSPGARQSWCPDIPALTTDASTDLTGQANTLERVRHVQKRYADTFMRRCPGVNGIGIGKVKGSRAVKDPAVPYERAARISHAEKDHLIVVYLLSERDRPRHPLFLEGVPVHFVRAGPIRAG